MTPKVVGSLTDDLLMIASLLPANQFSSLARILATLRSKPELVQFLDWVLHTVSRAKDPFDLGVWQRAVSSGLSRIGRNKGIDLLKKAKRVK